MANKSFSKDFITALITKANLVDSSGKIDTTQVELLAQELDKKMGIFIMGKLTAEELEEYYKLADKNKKPEELNEFVQKKIPDFSAQQKKFLDDYAYNFLSRTARIKQTLNK